MSEWRIRSVLVASLTLAVACSTVRYSADYDRQASFTDFQTYGWEALSEDERAALARVSPFLERRLQRAVDIQLADRGFVEDSQGNPDFWVSAYPVIPQQVAAAASGSAPGYPVAVVPRSNVSVSFGFGFGFGHPYAFGFPYYGFGFPYFGFGFPFYGFWNPYFGYPVRFGYRYPRYGFGRYGRYGRYPGFGFYPGFGVSYSTVSGLGYPAMGAAGGLQLGTVVVDVTDARTDDLVWRGWAEGALQEAPGTDQLSDYIDAVVAEIMKDFPPPNVSQ
jgi:hypothetical protein